MIFLDFDGVLFDSAREAFEVAFRTRFGEGEDAGRQAAWEAFIRLRPHVWSAWHYRVVMDAFAQGLEPPAALDAVQAVVGGAAGAQDREFESAFFACRQRLLAKDREAWLRLSPPYPFFDRLKPLLLVRPDAFCVVSTRNEASIRELLALHLEGTLPRIAGAETIGAAGGSKAQVIRAVLRPGERGMLVDDCRAHLDAAKGIEGLLLREAGWGYVPFAAVTDNSESVAEEIESRLRRDDGVPE